MANYFLNFPYTVYSFGDNELPVLTKDLSLAIDVFDNIQDIAELYEPYFIQEADRPDIVSQKLYNVSDNHWVFHLLNENLRKQGWPVQSNKLTKYVKEKYTNRVIIFDTSTDEYGLLKPGVADIEEHLTVGTEVISNDQVKGIIVKRNLNLGQLFVKVIHNEDSETGRMDFSKSTFIQYIANEQNINVTKTFYINGDIEEYNAVCKYTNDQNEVDTFDPRQYNSAEYKDGSIKINNVIGSENQVLTPVSILDNYIYENDKLRRIKVIKPDLIDNFVYEYKKLLRQ